MGSLFSSGLTNPTRVQQGDKTTQYQTPAQASTVADVASTVPTKMYNPDTATFDPSGALNLDPSTMPATTVRPDFMSASHDANGMPTPLSPSLTKGGKLLAVLGATAKGAGAGAGSWTFGQGFEKGVAEAPTEAMRNLGVEHAGFENQIAANQVQMLPWQRYMMQANLNKTQAETGKFTADTKAADAKAILDQAEALKGRYIEIPGQGLFDLKDPSGKPTPVPGTTQLVPLNANQAKVANMPEGSQVPVDFAKKLGEIADQSEMQVGANGHQYTVDKVSGRILKDWGTANSTVNARFNVSMANPMAGATLPLNTTGQVNDAALSRLSPLQQTAIRGIANYEIDPNAARARGIGPLQAITLAKQYDPSYDETQYGVKSALRKDFVAGPTSKVIRNLNTATQHLSMLEQATQALDNSDFPTLNKIANRLGFEVGSDKMTNFNNVRNAVAGELASIYKGSGVTPDAEIERVGATIPAMGSPAQLNGGIKQAIGLMGGRLGAIHYQYETGMGKPANFQIVSPESQAVFQKHGVPASPLQNQPPNPNPSVNPAQQLNEKYKGLGAVFN